MRSKCTAAVFSADIWDTTRCSEGSRPLEDVSCYLRVGTAMVADRSGQEPPSPARTLGS
jgi:hypothetical protein